MSSDDIRILRADIKSLNKKLDDSMELFRKTIEEQREDIKALQLSEARREGKESNLTPTTGTVIDGTSVVKIILGAFALVTIALGIAGTLAKVLLQ